MELEQHIDQQYVFVFRHLNKTVSKNIQYTV